MEPTGRCPRLFNIMTIRKASVQKHNIEPDGRKPAEEEDKHQPDKTMKNPMRVTVISILIAIIIYGLFFGVPFAVGFVLLILVHEMGHVVMLRALGYQANSPVFIPFVGAIIGMKDQPRDAQTEALVAFGGPFIGGIGAYLVYVYYQMTGNPLALTLAFTGFIINLFNLVPVSPLDGGRIATAISRWLWIPGLAFLLFLFFQIGNPIILLVVIIGISRVYKSLFKHEDLEATGYFTVKPAIRLLVSLAYFGLILFLGRLTWISYLALK
jgi:Zn-dependent protease